MKCRIESVNGQLTLVIPHAIAAEVGLVSGSDVEVTSNLNAIVIRIAGEDRYTLADLVAQITDENLHRETDWGPPRGREVW